MHPEYYLALLQLHLAVVGVVIAGVVALIQLLNNARPHRDIRLLAKRRILMLYGLLLAGLTLELAFGSWATTFPQQASNSFGQASVDFFGDGRVALLTIMLSLATLVWFTQLAFRARTLLDSRLYLRKYVSKVPASQVHRYLAAIYPSSKDLSPKANQPIPFDPFQPIREYIKDNAFQYYDYATADGLKQFGNLFDKALANAHSRKDNQTTYALLARYMSESCVEFFTIFAKTSSEKRKLDTITLLYDKGEMLRQAGCDPSLLPVVRGLEEIAKISNDDDEIIAAIERIRQLTDAYLHDHREHDWDHVAGPFDEICLSVSRITETYYLQKNNSLKTVPIISYSTGAYRTVTAALVDFFLAYRDLGDRYTDTQPLMYFEAIESVIEVLFVRVADIVDNGQQNIGFNMKYHDLAQSLYTIYYAFGIDAIEHNKIDLLNLTLSNLRRVIKPAKNFKLNDERSELCTMIVDLAGKGINTFGDVVIKDKRTISSYTIEILHKHTTRTQIINAVKAFEQNTVSTSPPVKRMLKRLLSVSQA